jgi:ADP-heptose:LPS heptosyltransferase
VSAPHVLVARLDNAGDVLLAGPAVRAVAAGARRVTMLVGPAGRAAAELLPGVDDVVVFDAPWVSFSAPPVDRPTTDALVGRLAALGLDQAILLTSYHQSPLPLALVLRLAGVPTIAATSADYPGTLLDVRRRPVAEDGTDRHEVERSLELVGLLGHRLADGDDGALALRRPLPGDRPFDHPYVVVHPGASVPARGWDAGRAAVLVDRLVEGGWRVAVTGGPGETALTATVTGPPRPGLVADLGGGTDLASLATVLEHASVVVSGNTGPAHLAAAVGTPVASIFAPVVPPSVWRPWGVPVELLGDLDIACAGCRARVCPFEGQPCLAAVGPDEVAEAVGRLAADRPRPTARPTEVPA